MKPFRTSSKQFISNILFLNNRMSSRRSARLSTAATTSKELPKSEALAQMPSTHSSNKRKKLGNERAKVDNNDDGPSTPKRKRVPTKAAPPITPTPSIVKLISTPYQNGTLSSAPAFNRLAAPNETNAALVTPETHRLVASKPVDQVSPSTKSSITATTGSILDEALAHLIRVEPKLEAVIEKHPCTVFSPEGLAEEIDPFNSLVSGILSQQVSGAAAKSIKAKFIALFNSSEQVEGKHVFPSPSQVCKSDISTLRTAGLSQRKAEYVLGLAEKFVSGEITTQFLFSAPYEEVFEKLIQVRGLGKWSVEMFACFGLKRLDIFSTGDLGVQRGMAALAGRDVAKLKNGGKGKWKYMCEKDMEEISDKFKPYRSVFMWYTWRVEDTDIDAFGQ